MKNDKKEKPSQPPEVSIPDPEYFETYDEDAEFVRDFGYHKDNLGSE